jgi:large subunit ribosomal protein L9
VKIILLRNVDDFGVKGQIVNIPYADAHKFILLPGFGVYHSRENAARHADILIPEETRLHSSESARQLVNYWAKRVLDVGMSREEAWSLEPWHIKAAFRYRQHPESCLLDTC